jgi:hypothetical protein
MKKAVVEKAGEIFLGAVRFAMDADRAKEQVRRAREKYPGLPADDLAEVILRVAARKTKWEGAANGLAISAGEAVVAVPIPEGAHKIPAGAGVMALLL